MQLKNMREMQRVLDNKIIIKHQLQGQDLIENTVEALQVELAELANEIRLFKHWSNKPPSPIEVILEEYVDGLHFILSLGNQLDIDTSIKPYAIRGGMGIVRLSINLKADCERFLDYKILSKQELQEHYFVYFCKFIGLGEMLGFTWDQVEAAYLDKNKINHQRQIEGY